MTKPRTRRKPDKRIDFADQGGFSPFWLLHQDLRTSAKFDALLMKEGLLGVRNATELDVRLREIKTATSNWSSDNFALPDDFPPARVTLSRTDFAPDYLDIGPDKFCSRRLRDVLALPHDVVQFLPIEAISGSDQARSQDYRRMHILARQPALDLERSGCVMEEVSNVMTGKSFLMIDTMERFVLLEGLRAKSDLLLIDELGFHILVTDALAARVLQSGCTGMEFHDPANPLPITGTRIERYRTKSGIAERRVGFLD